MILIRHKLSRFFSASQALSKVNPQAAQKSLELIQRNKPLLDRVYYYDPDIMGSLPFFLDFLDEPVERYKDLFMSIQALTGWHWVSVLATCSFGIRLAIFPLMILQIRKSSELGPVLPAILSLHSLYKSSSLPKMARLRLLIRGSLRTVIANRVPVVSSIGYTGVHVSFIVFSVLSLRRLVSQQGVRDTTFLWLNGFANMDQYFICPVLAVIIIYMNLGRGITRANQKNLINRVKGIGQVLVILWLPIICYWPSGITLFILLNSLLSTLQMLIISQPLIRRYLVNQNISMMYHMMHQTQLSPEDSKAFKESIRKGEQRFPNVSQQQLMAKLQEDIKQLNSFKKL